ncbi:MAG TPA: response regulator [Alphaproteobacteria bacterium]|nr:response regulator [Alphaproteobacteria bacterium]
MPASPSGKLVLIVEDNELNTKLFRDLLLSKGHRVLETRDGKEALRLAHAEHPDLILMDIQLPEISGYDLIKMIKKEPDIAAIPIIAVTAFAMKGDEEKIRQSGCNDYLAKPISVSSFFSIVQSHLR